jgi:hypothetical protein
MLKRAARYLKSHPRLVQTFPYQNSFQRLDGWSDTDHAGCIRTRKSTTGGSILLGSCCTKFFCKGQAVIALSSGEAEYYGFVSMGSQLLGEHSMLLDWGVSLGTPNVNMDASAGIAIGSRRGLGRVKHIDTVFLWVQEVVDQGRLRLTKKKTTEMLADILTKPTCEATLVKMLTGLNFHYKDGRHKLSLQV